MADSVTVANLPPGYDLYGVYDDGAYNNIAAAKARGLGGIIVPITVFATDHFGTVLDVENGDATPEQAPGWVVARRLVGVDPTVYCSFALWSTCKQAFAAAGVPEPHWWIAAYPGPGPVLYPGSVAHQYEDYQNLYDLSVVADYWPGVDSPQGVAMPAPTDVVDRWTVPGSGGSQYFNLHADGGLFSYGGAVPSALEYIAVANDGSGYHFGPNVTPGTIAYPGLPPADRQGTRYFVALNVIAYEGAPVGVGVAGPPGESGVSALKAALQQAANSVP